jgi:nicotinamidase-related amidase
MCIDATCRRARALGYDVILVKDAHSTFDTDALTAAQLIARYNDALSACAQVADASAIGF